MDGTVGGEGDGELDDVHVLQGQEHLREGDVLVHVHVLVERLDVLHPHAVQLQDLLLLHHLHQEVLVVVVYLHSDELLHTFLHFVEEDATGDVCFELVLVEEVDFAVDILDLVLGGLLEVVFDDDLVVETVGVVLLVECLLEVDGDDAVDDDEVVEEALKGALGVDDGVLVALQLASEDDEGRGPLVLLELVGEAELGLEEDDALVVAEQLHHLVLVLPVRRVDLQDDEVGLRGDVHLLVHHLPLVVPEREVQLQLRHLRPLDVHLQVARVLLAVLVRDREDRLSLLQHVLQPVAVLVQELSPEHREVQDEREPLPSQQLRVVLYHDPAVVRQEVQRLPVRVVLLVLRQLRKQLSHVLRE